MKEFTCTLDYIAAKLAHLTDLIVCKNDDLQALDALETELVALQLALADELASETKELERS